MRLSFLALVLVALVFPQAEAQQKTAKLKSGESGWRLTWSDEFNGANGSAPDPAKWTVESGGLGWGNDELECYTPRPENVHQENGNLVIEALKEDFTGADGRLRKYTSARLKSQGHFSQRYGRFEARIRLPAGKGMWPAFWMLGDDFNTVGWPACGEIDVMENTGEGEPTTIHGSMHGPGYSSTNPLTATYSLPKGYFSESFHVFAVEWEPQVVRFLVDGKLYATKTPKNLPAGKRWVFEHPFFLVLNLAVGGKMPGSPDESTPFPQRMLVDYVRVYSRE